MSASRPPLPRISPRLLALFSRYAERYTARAFHAVRLAREGRPDEAAFQGRPLIVYLNHPAWWDPLVCLLLARRIFPGRRHYAPIDAAALGKYRFFEKLGFFGIEAGTLHGARRFVEAGLGLLESPDATLWITAAGRFTDPRERGVELRAGIGYLMRHLRGGAALPLALEYPFREERFPEALARFGLPLEISRDGAPNAVDWATVLGGWLEVTQDALAADALARDPSRFEDLLAGSAGVGGAYDAWRRLRARLRGERFRPEHGELGRKGGSRWAS